VSKIETVQAPGWATLSWFDRAVFVLNAFGSIWVLLIVVLICSDSFGRSFFNRPLDGVNELVAVSMAFIVFCQLPDTVRLSKLTRSDTYLPRLQASSVLICRLIVCGFDILGSAMMLAIVIGTTPLLLESIERGYYIGEQGIFTIPEWPIKGMVVLGSTATMLCFAIRAVKHWRTSENGPV
jgi:TRAP-type mannitol/chloroaromatic compound transport system permease small subunit